MRKLLITSILVLSFLLPITSKADPNLFLNLGIGIGVPAPVFIAPAPVVYPVPNFAVISPSVFFSFGIGIASPVFVAPAPVVVAPSFVAFTESTVIADPPLVISHSEHITADPSLHRNVQLHRGFPGHFDKSTSAIGRFSPRFAHAAPHTNAHTYGGSFGHLARPTPIMGRSSPGFAHSTPHTNAHSYRGHKG